MNDESAPVKPWSIISSCASRDELLKYDLDKDAISSIFGLSIGEINPGLPTPALGCDKHQIDFWKYEYASSATFMNSIRNGFIELPSIRKDASESLRSLSSKTYSEFPGSYTVCQLISFGKLYTEYICAFATIYPRVTHIIVPSSRLIIWYPYHQSLCRGILSIVSDSILLNESSCVNSSRTIVGIDMMSNYAHHMLNHLSGIEFLYENQLIDRINSLWICGKEYFGSLEELYPSLSGKVNRYTSRREFCKSINDLDCFFLKIGSCFFTDTLRHRLSGCQYTPNSCSIDKSTKSRKTIVCAITIRSSNRQCHNLDEVVFAIHQEFALNDVKMQILFDGYTIGSSELINKSAIHSIIEGKISSYVKSELEAASRISSSLPGDCIVGNTIGWSLQDSLLAIKSVDCYFSHVGTLQHKIAYMTAVPGYVHGPSAQLIRKEAAHWLYEGTYSPYFLDESDVIDVRDESIDANPHNYSYKIANPAKVAKEFTRMVLGIQQDSR